MSTTEALSGIQKKMKEKKLKTEGNKKVRGYRKRTGFDVFCRRTGPVPSGTSHMLKSWAEEWKQVPMKEKNGCQEIADNLELTPLNNKQRSRRKEYLLSHLNTVMTELDTLGVPAVLYVMDDSAPIVLSSGEKGASFISSFPSVEEDFEWHCQQEVTESKDDLLDRKVLRREVQQLFNEKYAEALGVETASVPYLKLDIRGITVDGLPPGTGLTKPSSYGVRKMRQILAMKDGIRFHVRNPPTKEESMDQKAENVVGAKIKYLWTVETSKGISTEWFQGRITGYDTEREMYSVTYDGFDSVDYVSMDTVANTKIFRFIE